MDIEALNTFLILANTKNYTRTAAQLFVAQSTVTNRIHELEKELNIALFTRNNRSVELTVEGEEFKDYAEKVITLTNASLSEISSLHKYANHLRIGCSDSIYEGHLAPIILEHRRQFPNDALKITIGLSNLLMDQLQSDIFDVIFTYVCARHHEAGVDRRELSDVQFRPAGCRTIHPKLISALPSVFAGNR